MSVLQAGDLSVTGNIFFCLYSLVTKVDLTVSCVGGRETN